MTLDESKMAGAPRPRSPAERMRPYRQRRRCGQLCLRIQIGRTEIAALADKGYLDPAEREDIGALEFAVIAFISDTLLEP